ncbi:hypothetical protein BKA70DRAFT_182211 [Coprinopsis sp. MPI-PUGE-AT-0042]|nr:hypothetical protein BKA70DRAFT_182211 [Coprinopsis sp. MPI-PUGE-AT-0042]
MKLNRHFAKQHQSYHLSFKVVSFLFLLPLLRAVARSLTMVIEYLQSEISTRFQVFHVARRHERSFDCDMSAISLQFLLLRQPHHWIWWLAGLSHFEGRTCEPHPLTSRHKSVQRGAKEPYIFDSSVNYDGRTLLSLR